MYKRFRSAAGAVHLQPHSVVGLIWYDEGAFLEQSFNTDNSSRHDGTENTHTILKSSQPSKQVRFCCHKTLLSVWLSRVVSQSVYSAYFAQQLKKSHPFSAFALFPSYFLFALLSCKVVSVLYHSTTINQPSPAKNTTTRLYAYYTPEKLEGQERSLNCWKVFLFWK